jgi:hypothetical protein
VDEKDLVRELKQAREAKERAEEVFEVAKKEEARLELALIELLEANNANRTASYDGLGGFTLQRPKVYANVTKENQGKLFEFLHEIGRQDLIREGVPAPTLSSFVSERLENGEGVPEFIGYFLKTGLRAVK